MSELSIQENSAGVTFKVKVVPGGSRNATAGALGDILKIKVAAVAEKGKANSAVIDLLAKKLGVRKKFIRILSGKTSPVKEILVEGITAKQISELL